MRPYRWQDPPPPPVQSIKLRREQLAYFRSVDKLQPPSRLHEMTVKQWAESGDPDPVPSMVIEGVEYVERAQDDALGCKGCAFMDIYCDDMISEARRVFGGHCQDRRVIYIRKA